MSARERLPNRRNSEVFSFEAMGLDVDRAQQILADAFAPFREAAP